MTSDELYERFRSDVFDTVDPYLWSDEDVYAYMNDAYFMFVRMTGGISDMSSDAAVVGATADEPFADLHPAVLNIRKAYRADGRELKIVNITEDFTQGVDDYGNPVSSLLADPTPGPLRFIILGLEQDKVRFHPIPAVAEDVQLLIYRLPLEFIKDDGQPHELVGVKAEHHIHLTSWMKALAYRKADQETFDLTKANEYEKRFVDYCNMAKAEWERYKAKPYRAVAYGGL